MNEAAHLISAINYAGFLRRNNKHCYKTMERALARAHGAVHFIISRPTHSVAGRHAPFTVKNFSKRGSQIHGCFFIAISAFYFHVLS